MESNGLNKQNRDRLIENRLPAMGGGEGVEGQSRKEKGLMNMDNSVVIVGAGSGV